MRRILVTGATTPLGRRLIDHLRNEPGVDTAQGIELTGRDVDHRKLTAFLDEQRIDTVVHCALAAERSGAAVEPSGGDVIGTMRLCAAFGRASLPVRSLVLASSSSVYPAQSHEPLLRGEDARTVGESDTLAATLLEAEEYARDVARRLPHLNVALLRLGELAGPEVRSPLSALLQLPVVPALIGFDPPVQLLHIEDALHALAFAVRVELAGLYNVASDGVVHWSVAARALGRRTFPLLPLGAGPLTPLLRRLSLPHVPTGMVEVLRFGRVLDTAKLSAAGCPPVYDQAACLASLATRSEKPPARWRASHAAGAQKRTFS